MLRKIILSFLLITVIALPIMSVYANAVVEQYGPFEGELKGVYAYYNYKTHERYKERGVDHYIMYIEVYKGDKTVALYIDEGGLELPYQYMRKSPKSILIKVRYEYEEYTGGGYYGVETPQLFFIAPPQATYYHYWKYVITIRISGEDYSRCKIAFFLLHIQINLSTGEKIREIFRGTFTGEKTEIPMG